MIDSSAAEFPKFLGICMETFITLIDDSDVDIKMVADECLNQVIRVSSFSAVDFFDSFVICIIVETRDSCFVLNAAANESNVLNC